MARGQLKTCIKDFLTIKNTTKLMSTNNINLLINILLRLISYMFLILSIIEQLF